MSLLCFWDTETQFLPLWKEPSEHPDQPHIVELAAVLVDTQTRAPMLRPPAADAPRRAGRG